MTSKDKRKLAVIMFASTKGLNKTNYQKEKQNEKTKPIIRILLGISILFLISGIYHYFTNGMETKDVVRISIGVIILIGLYLKKLIIYNTLLTSLKDSLPYFTVLFLISDLVKIEWMVLVLAGAIFIADFTGDG